MKIKVAVTPMIILTAVLSYFCLVSCAGTDSEGAIVYSPQSLLIPQPVEQVFSEGEFILGPGTVISAEGVEQALTGYLAGVIEAAYPQVSKKANGKRSNSITLKYTEAAVPPEGYFLTVEPENITLEAADREGIFYGIQTLFQLLPPEIYGGEPLEGLCAIPAQRITDYPRFGYRGMMLDVARTFMDKHTVLDFIDHMAAHKLNKLHWHLADDEGWRIEIKSHPELAEIGGFRGGDSPVQPIYGHWDRKYGGYFTQDEVREVVQYAAFRNIEIIPEIDLPGHSRAAGKVYPHILCGVAEGTVVRREDRRNVWCAAKESNYEILEDILDELCDLFPSEYIHIGGDEVGTGQWKACPDCQRLMRAKGYGDAKLLSDYFAERLTEILAGRGRKPAVWDEVSESGNFTRNSHIYGWQGTRECVAATGKGYKTVVMPGSYFYIDMMQSPEEPGANWAAIVTAERLYSFNFENFGFGEKNMANVLGVQAAFFSEIMASHEPEYLDYQTYPRMCALSEVAWSPQESREWDDFYRRLTGEHLDRLYAMGIKYRMFPPVVDFSNSTVTALPPFEGVEIRYTSDGTEPGPESTLYEGPIAEENPEDYLFRAFYKTTASPSVTPTAKYTHKVPAGKTETFTFDLADRVNTPGIWYVQIRTSDSDNVRINKISVNSAAGSTNILSSPWRINESHIMRFTATERNRTGTMSVTVNNPNKFACGIRVELRPSPYIQPEVRVTSSMTENTRFPFSNAQDYNFTSYSRTTATCRKGDHITYTFTKPVDAQSIDIRTGLSHMPRYHIPFGRVQTSRDGVNFSDAAQLEFGKAVIRPDGPIKAVRIVSDSDGNSETAVAFYDLRIKPNKK